MGVASKNRRKITVGGRTYLWYVSEDIDDFPPMVSRDLRALNILSKDKRFIVRYHLGQTVSERRHITVIGGEFGGAQDPGCWRRFLCPDWCPDTVVTPGVVRSIIEWCLDPAIRTAVDYTGTPQGAPLKERG